MASETLGSAELDEFIRDLIELREACGSPSLRDLAAASREVQARHAEDRTGLQALSTTAISDVLARRRKRPPTWRWVASYVLACQCYARRSGAWPVDPGVDTLPGWHRHYRSVRAAVLPSTLDQLDTPDDLDGRNLALDAGLVHASLSAMIENVTADLNSERWERDSGTPLDGEGLTWGPVTASHSESVREGRGARTPEMIVRPDDDAPGARGSATPEPPRPPRPRPPAEKASGLAYPAHEFRDTVPHRTDACGHGAPEHCTSGYDGNPRASTTRTSRGHERVQRDGHEHRDDEHGDDEQAR